MISIIKYLIIFTYILSTREVLFAADDEDILASSKSSTVKSALTPVKITPDKGSTQSLAATPDVLNDSFTCPTYKEVPYKSMHHWKRKVEINNENNMDRSAGRPTSITIHIYTDKATSAVSAVTLDKFNNLFDNRTFPFIRQVFKSNDTPKNIVFVQTNKIKVRSLFCESFQSENEFVILVAPNFFSGEEYFQDIIVHEYTHFYFYINNFKLPLWYEEGTSLLVEYLYNNIAITNSVNTHLEFPTTSLTEGFSSVTEANSAYGHAHLMFIYLYNRMGDYLLNELMTNKNGNLKTLSSLIQTAYIDSDKNLPWDSFSMAFEKFQIAKRVNREDYSQTRLSADRQKYFIFNSKLHAKDYFDDHAQFLKDGTLARWSSTAFSDLSTVSIELQKIYTCLVVVNPKYSRVSVIPCGVAEPELLKPSKNRFYILIRKD